jgi:glycosyltransferase involved in cell wall biosynthesis
VGEPLISVIVPTWNRAALLGRAVKSVLAQTYENFELLVVDDGSDDGTADLLAPWERAGRLTKLRNPVRRGVSAARNVGLAAAQGELVAFLDSDDEWLPEKLSAQAAFMTDRPQLLISQCQERWMRGDRRVNPGRRHHKIGGDIFLPSLRRCLVSPSAVVLRPELIKLIGGFDESLPAAEDYDLWLRVTARWEVGLLDRELLIRHGGRPDQLSSAPGLDRWRIRALKKILRCPLSPERRAAAERELARRRTIYEAGRRKRAAEKGGACGEDGL